MQIGDATVALTGLTLTNGTGTPRSGFTFWGGLEAEENTCDIETA